MSECQGYRLDLLSGYVSGGKAEHDSQPDAEEHDACGRPHREGESSHRGGRRVLITKCGQHDPAETEKDHSKDPEPEVGREQRAVRCSIGEVFPDRVSFEGGVQVGT